MRLKPQRRGRRPFFEVRIPLIISLTSGWEKSVNGNSGKQFRHEARSASLFETASELLQKASLFFRMRKGPVAQRVVLVLSESPRNVRIAAFYGNPKQSKIPNEKDRSPFKSQSCGPRRPWIVGNLGGIPLRPDQNQSARGCGFNEYRSDSQPTQTRRPLLSGRNYGKRHGKSAMPPTHSQTSEVHSVS